MTRFSDERRGALVPVGEGLLRLRPIVSCAAVSPGGRYVAWTPAEAGQAELVVTDIATGDEVVRIVVAARASGFLWCSPERLLVLHHTTTSPGRAALHEMPDGGVVGECELPLRMTEAISVELSRDGRLVCFHDTTYAPLVSHTRALPELTRVGDAERDGRHGEPTGTAVSLHPDGHEIACVSHANRRSVIAFLSTRDGGERAVATLREPREVWEPAWVGPSRLALTVVEEHADTLIIERPDVKAEVAAMTVAQLVGERSFSFDRLAVSTTRAALLGAAHSGRSREVSTFVVADVDARVVLARGRCPETRYGSPTACFTSDGRAGVVVIPTTRGTTAMFLGLEGRAARAMELPASRIAAGRLFEQTVPSDFVPLFEPVRPLASERTGGPSRLLLLSLELLRTQGKAVNL